MNLVKNKWTEKDYDEYLKYLESFYNEKGAAFGRKLIFTKYEIIGMKMADMRAIAKEIFKGDYNSFLKLTVNKYYEETVIEGFVREHTKDLKYIEEFLPKIDNWAICDSLKLKWIQKDLDNHFKYFLQYLKDNREYYCRFGLVMLLAHYTSNKYVEEIFKEVDKIKLDYYYVKMGMAWVLCECYIKAPEKTEQYLLVAKIDDWTFNKTISKIRESFRVSQEKKDFLNTLKRKRGK